MSRMSAPTMEVVRFKEADVIVASGATRTFSSGNFNDGVAGNATISLPNGYTFTNTSSSGEAEWTPLYNQLSDYFKTTINGDTEISNGSSNAVGLQKLLHDETFTNYLPGYDGDFYYDTQHSVFRVYQHQ